MPAVRRFAKRVIPQRVRLWRYQLIERLTYYPRLILSLGRGFQCPFCRWHFRRFLPAGFLYPVLIEKKVIGGHWHQHNVCPRCLSNARERLVFLFLKDRTSVFERHVRLLHLAPEPELASVLSRTPSIQYISADLAAPLVMSHLDIQMMPFPAETFDVVLCNHVMEHVMNDRVAMAEVFRVLRPGGWALLQVPIALALERTVEDSTLVSAAERIRRFGQADHVRLYARGDYIARLQSTGFTVYPQSYPAELGVSTARLFGLVWEEEVFLCSKPSIPSPESDM
jgi:SAM-dependent methyltransferase